MTQKPELQGERADWQFRVHTVEHLPFDALPEYWEGGPATVALDPWNVSYTGGVGPDGKYQYELHIYRFTDPIGPSVKHDLDGTVFATMREASRAAFEASALGFMVYERDAGQYAARIAAAVAGTSTTVIAA